MNDLKSLSKSFGNSINKTSIEIFSKYGEALSRGKKIFIFIFIILIIIFIGLIVNEVKKSSFEISHINDFDIFTSNPQKADVSVVVEGANLESSNTNEFCYSFWVYINSSMWNADNVNLNKWKHVFHRGSHGQIDSNLELQVPGVWLWPNTNRLWCVISTENGPEYGEGLVFDDIPVNKWTHVTLSLVNNTFDLYLNGKLERTITLYRNPKTVNNSHHLYFFGISNDINSLINNTIEVTTSDEVVEDDACSKCRPIESADKCEQIIEEETGVDNDGLSGNNLNNCTECSINESYNPLNPLSNKCICTATEENEVIINDRVVYPMDGFIGHFKYLNRYVTPNEIYNIYKDKSESVKDWNYKYLEELNSLEHEDCEKYLCFTK